MGALTSSDGSHSTVELGDLVSQMIEDPVKRSPGVRSISTFGSGYTMGIWLDPMKMAQDQVKLAEVTAAVSEQNSNVTVGDLGAEPSAEGRRLTLTLSAQPQSSSAPEFERILLRVDPDGSTVFWAMSPGSTSGKKPLAGRRAITATRWQGSA